jgi:hypothetical protein
VACLGHYNLYLTVNGETSATTLDYLPENTQKSFFVDPSAEHVGDGSSLLPWRDFADGNPDNAMQWAAINDALRFYDVIIYFSARHADTDTAEEMTNLYDDAVVRVKRTDTSTHRLTLDGHALYNTNVFSGAWTYNMGLNSMRLVMTGGCCISIGWDNDASYDYVTLRGFEVTGSGARVRWGGSYSTIEYMNIHDVMDLGATLQFTPALIDGTCIPLGIDHAVTLRHNQLHRTIGEAIYIASNYNYVEDGGCIDGPYSGDNHYDFLIEGNIVDQPGFHGGEGDAIDLKAGIYNVTIRGNLLTNLVGYGITTLGQMPNSTHLSNYLIEGNIIEDAPPPWYASISPNGLKGAIIRNNVLRDCIPGSYGAITQDVRAPGTPTGAQFQLENNTIDGGCYSFVFAALDDVPILRNNLFLDPGSIVSSNSGLDSDYNLFVGAFGDFAEGPNSVLVPTNDGIVRQVGMDDHLVPNSPAIGVGLNLSPLFTADIERTPRSLDGPWDIGAYTFQSANVRNR